MSAQAFRYLNHNEGQKITHDTVLSRIGKLEWENLRSLVLMLNGQAETVCFYGLDSTVDESNTTQITLSSGALAQWASEGDFDDLNLEDDSNLDLLFKVAVLAEDVVFDLASKNIADGKHIIEGYIDRVLDADTKEDVQVFSSSGSSNQFLTQEQAVDRKVNFIARIKQGGDSLPSVTKGYVKLAEIEVESFSVTAINGIYAQDSWEDQDSSIATGQSLSGLKSLIESSTSELSEDITELEESIKSLLSDAASISITEDTTINSIHKERAAKPDGSGLNNNLFDIDLTASGLASFEQEMVLVEDIYLDEYGYYQTEDERLRFKGSWTKESESEFYKTQAAGSQVIFTFLGSNVFAIVKMDEGNSIKVKVDSQSENTLSPKTLSKGGFLPINISSNSSRKIHTVTLTAINSFEIKGFLVIDDFVESDDDTKTIYMNTGQYNILNNLIVPETQTLDLPTYTTGYGRRDLILVNQDTADFEFASGTSIAEGEELYSLDIQSRDEEELAYEMEAISYQEFCSSQDNWSGIYAPSLGIHNELGCLFASSLKAGERFEFRFEGSGLSLELDCSQKSKFQLVIDNEQIGSDQNGIIEVASGKQVLEICSHLVYSDHVVELYLIADEEDVDAQYSIYLYNTFIYRPKTPINSVASKLAVAAVNLVSNKSLKYQMLNKIAYFEDVEAGDWEIESDSHCWGGLKCSNSDSDSSDLTFYVFGEKLYLYGNKGPSKGKFKINVGNQGVIDCSLNSEGEALSEDSYNQLLTDTAIDLGFYGLHQITINVEGTESKAVELVAIASNRRSFLDNQSNFLFKKTEVVKSQGFKERFDELYRTLKIDSQKRELQVSEIKSDVDKKIKEQAFINALIFG